MRCFLLRIAVFISIGYKIVCATEESLVTPGVEATQHTLSFFFVPKKHISLKQDFQTTSKLIESTLASQFNMVQEEVASIVSGIPVVTGGRVTTSDYYGQVLLPRVYTGNELWIFVTERPTPIIEHGNTLKGWQVSANYIQYPTDCYQLIRITEGQSTYWQTRKVDKLSVEIPFNSLIIYSHPSTIIIAEGTSPTTPGENFILPDIYVSRKYFANPPELLSIAVSRFFEPVQRLFAYGPAQYAFIII